jgi:hypothetical protein
VHGGSRDLCLRSVEGSGPAGSAGEVLSESQLCPSTIASPCGHQEVSGLRDSDMVITGVAAEVGMPGTETAGDSGRTTWDTFIWASLTLGPSSLSLPSRFNQEVTIPTATLPGEVSMTGPC